MLRFRKDYFLLTAIFFITETLIALYVHDSFIRPWLGDYLVVMFLYCLIRTFLAYSVLQTAIFVLLLSYLIEVTQYFNLAQLLGLEQSELALIIIGSTFEWTDILAYTLGILTVIGIEKLRLRNLNTD